MQVKYAGKKFEILSTSDVRYQGHMYSADPSELSIAFKNVFCYGTEDRRTGDQKVEMSTCTYEYIVFRAVSLRELWLLEGNGRRLDVTDEILIPLRAGKGVNLAATANGKAPTDDAPKRKVGYQSRSQQRQQGYDQYYQGGPPQGPYGGYNRRGGYGPPPNQAPYDAPPDYPPMRDPYYRQYQNGGGPPQGYYDQGYYGYGRRQGGGGYRQRQAYYDGYRQRERAPQYYNQRGGGGYYQQGYRDQGYYARGGGYRDPRQYNRDGAGNYPRQRGYRDNRGYGQGRRGRGPSDQGSGQVGTGAYLDNRRLRGDEIDIKDQQDFDFGAAKDEFALSKDEMKGLVSAVDSMALEAGLGAGKGQKEEDNKEEQQAKEKQAAEAQEEAQAEQPAAEKDEAAARGKEEKTSHYDASKSFFDGLETETKRSKPRQDMQTQKDVDTSTFGSVAQSYKSRHINRPNQRGPRGYGRQRGYGGGGGGYPQQRRQDYYDAPPQEQYGRRQRAPQVGSGYSSNRWVPK